ncbi:hypothetical protein BDV25DRAFT_126014 [Aspergillus avenaceus]|uniref:NAD(P)-binding protein n=1 Tax=Aspergillus avenaceus TaxID=36643 RepID=A0A5N6U9Q3_ASPAV|nr:hypothetical protein BDV25DRAFT_126014 [Aspergillus avenaceus]
MATLTVISKRFLQKIAIDTPKPTIKPKWSPATIDSRPVAIVGAGVIGCRIACVFTAAGYDVHIMDTSEKARDAALLYLEQNISQYSLLPKKARPMGQCLVFPDLVSAVREAWLVIEVVPESLPLKIITMGKLDKMAPTDCILASGSSSYRSHLMLDKVSASRRPLVCNMHFTRPPNTRPVELMTDGHTYPEIFPFLTHILKDCGMLPVTAHKESTGFILNRLWAAIKRETLTILAEGVSTPDEVDKLWSEVFTESFRPCSMMDQVGLDTVASIEDNYIIERRLDASLTVDWLRRNYIEQGKIGSKASKGGLYPPRPREVEESPSMYCLSLGRSSSPSNATFFGDAGRILRSTGEGKPLTTVISGIKGPDGIGISPSTGRIFWTNMGLGFSRQDGTVMSANLDGSDVRTIIPEGAIVTPKQLVVDDQDRKLYFCDREGMGVHRCDFEGHNHEVLVSRGKYKATETPDPTKWCVGIALDRSHGKVYWTQKGPSKGFRGRIFRASIDMPPGENASNRSDIQTLFTNLPEPVDLGIVPDTEVLYWTDRGEHPRGNTLNRADMGQQSPTVEIISRHFHEPIGLMVDAVHEHVYVADLGGTVYRFDMDGGDRQVIHDDDNFYTGMTLF